MKENSIAVVALLMLALACPAETVKTRTGATYDNVKVTKNDGVSITVAIPHGTIVLPLESLSPETQKQLNYKFLAERTREADLAKNTKDAELAKKAKEEKERKKQTAALQGGSPDIDKRDRLAARSVTQEEAKK